ncbi:MAG: transporter [Massilia sp.]|nr:transporter [Massilia sp.]
MLAALSLSILLSSLGTSIANVGLPSIALAQGASFQAVQWVVLAYLLAITGLVVGAGRLGDVIGRRRLLMAGILIFTLASACCGAAPTLPLLIAARAAQGAGAAVMLALGMALGSAAAPEGKTGSAMGLLGAMAATGTALGPSLGGALIAWHGWPAIFFINTPLGMLALFLAWRYVPREDPRPGAQPGGFDLAGTLLLAATLTAYALAVTFGRGSFGPVNLALLLAFLAGGVLFVLAEKQSASPLVRLAMFRDPIMKAGLAMSFLVTAVVMATLVVGPFYLAKALGLGPAGVGLAMSSGPIVAALASVPAGRLVDRHGAQSAAVAGLAAMAAGCCLLPMLATRFGAAGYVAALAVITAGYALFQAANNTAVMMRSALEGRGVISGMLNLSRNLGLITGASVMGAVFALGAQAADIMAAAPGQIAAGMRATFAVAAVLTAVALAIAIAGRARGGQAGANGT